MTATAHPDLSPASYDGPSDSKPEIRTTPAASVRHVFQTPSSRGLQTQKNRGATSNRAAASASEFHPTDSEASHRACQPVHPSANLPWLYALRSSKSLRRLTNPATTMEPARPPAVDFLKPELRQNSNRPRHLLQQRPAGSSIPGACGPQTCITSCLSLTNCRAVPARVRLPRTAL